MNHWTIIKSAFFLSFYFFSTNIYGQCYPDRHSSNIEDVWLSCSESANPNPLRERGHWILYELDKEKTIHSIKVWNINHPDHLTDGAKKITVDYQNAGGQWKEYGVFDIKVGDGSGFYEGENIDMPETFQASQVLIQITENYGGACYGIAEVKMGTQSATVPTEDISEEHFDITIMPNPFSQFTSVTIGDLEKSEISYEIINGAGQILDNRIVKTHNGTAQFEIDAKELPSGTYFLKIKDGLRVSSRKLIHQNQ